MLVVDASCLFEVVIHTPLGSVMEERSNGEPLAAPHLVDVEVMSTVRRWHHLGQIDGTAAALAISELRDWPGQRFGHQLLLERAWQLRDNVRGWDAMYVALAEILGVPLLTTDARLARATGPRCPIEVVGRTP